jgi:hypothetical protein
VFNNTMSNILRQNTTNTYNLLKYKRQHVSVLTEPSSGQFDSHRLRTLCVCVHIMGSQSVHIIMTAKYENNLPMCRKHVSRTCGKSC